jgi:hypothetical protein
MLALEDPLAPQDLVTQGGQPQAPAPQLLAIAAVLADTPTTMPMSLRIGPERHNYKYHLVYEGIYLCCRGSDKARVLGNGDQLVLLQTANGHWTAFDLAIGKAPFEAEAFGIPVFDTTENAVLPGRHTWRSNYNRNRNYPDWRSTGLSCETTHL